MSTGTEPVQRISVLAIAGAGRSGSTILDKILGRQRGVFSVGELDHFWDAGLTQNYLCSCGARTRNCSFWANVLEEGFGGVHKLDVPGILELKESVDRAKHLPHIAVRKSRSAAFNRKVETYCELLERLYLAIHKVSQARLLLDSSKSPAYLSLLNRVEIADVRVLHLVRDSRAVAHSWTRTKTIPQLPGQNAQMGRKGPLSSAIHWSGRNLLARVLARSSYAYSLLRYEDLTKDPDSFLTAAMSKLGEDLDLSCLRGATPPKADHAVVGNPIRFEDGPLRLRFDEAWKTAMPALSKGVVTLITWPLLLAYGYPVLRSTTS